MERRRFLAGLGGLAAVAALPSAIVVAGHRDGGSGSSSGAIRPIARARGFWECNSSIRPVGHERARLP